MRRLSPQKHPVLPPSFAATLGQGAGNVSPRHFLWGSSVRYLLFLGSVLVIPLASLLFLQWPLREWVQAYSREANDLGQVLFAIYVAVAVLAASRAGAHLIATNMGGNRSEGGINRGSDGDFVREPGLAPWRTWAVLLCVVPWAAFMLWASVGTIEQSVRGLERFSETLNPGYFAIKLAVGLLLVLVLVDAFWDALKTLRRYW